MRRETVVGATGPGSRTLTYPKALNELLGPNSRSCPAIPAATRSRSRWSAARSKAIAAGRSAASRPARRTGSATARSGRSRSSRLAKTGDLPNVPLATDLAGTENGRRAIEFFAADSVLAWPLVAPPDVPAERVAELRAAFDAMMQDPQLLAEAATPGPRYRSGERRGDRRAGRPPLWHAARTCSIWCARSTRRARTLRGGASPDSPRRTRRGRRRETDIRRCRRRGPPPCRYPCRRSESFAARSTGQLPIRSSSMPGRGLRRSESQR